MKHLLFLSVLGTFPGLAHAQSFGAVTAYPVSNMPVAVAAGDFNHDGYVDAVIARYANNSAAIALNKKDGTFALNTGYAVSASNYSVGTASVAVGDLNGDGYLDVVTLSYYEHVASILLNNQAGAFAPFVAYATNAYPIALAVADVNRDGSPDLVVAHSNGTPATSSIGVLLNKKDGTFAPLVAYLTGGNSRIAGVAVGDVNGDGYADIATGYADSNGVGVLLNQKNGTFAAPVLYAAGGVVQPLRVRLSDVNQDGFEDLVTSGAADNVAVLLNKKDGTFTAAATYSVRVGKRLTALAVSDVSGDRLFRRQYRRHQLPWP